MVGEEAVTLDIVPLLRCMSELRRLEDTMYLSMFAMERWAKLMVGFSGGGYGSSEPQTALERENAETMEMYERLSRRRLEALAVARTMNVAEVDASAVEAFEPEELQHVG